MCSKEGHAFAKKVLDTTLGCINGFDFIRAGGTGYRDVIVAFVGIVTGDVQFKTECAFGGWGIGHIKGGSATVTDHKGGTGDRIHRDITGSRAGDVAHR